MGFDCGGQTDTLSLRIEINAAYKIVSVFHMEKYYCLNPSLITDGAGTENTGTPRWRWWWWCYWCVFHRPVWTHTDALNSIYCRMPIHFAIAFTFRSANGLSFWPIRCHPFYPQWIITSKIAAMQWLSIYFKWIEAYLWRHKILTNRIRASPDKKASILMMMMGGAPYFFCLWLSTQVWSLIFGKFNWILYVENVFLFVFIFHLIADAFSYLRWWSESDNWNINTKKVEIKEIKTYDKIKLKRHSYKTCGYCRLDVSANINCKIKKKKCS